MGLKLASWTEQFYLERKKVIIHRVLELVRKAGGRVRREGGIFMLIPRGLCEMAAWLGIAGRVGEDRWRRRVRVSGVMNWA